MLLAEQLFAILFVILIITQVVLPPFIGKPFFFILRPWLMAKKSASHISAAKEHKREAEAELAAAKAEAEAIKLRREAEKIRIQVMEEVINDGLSSETETKGVSKSKNNHS